MFHLYVLTVEHWKSKSEWLRNLCVNNEAIEMELNIFKAKLSGSGR